MASSSLLRLRLHVLAPSSDHAQRLVELLASALDTPGAWKGEAGVVCLGDGATLEVHALPHLLSVARHKVLKRPPISRLCSVAIERSVGVEDGEEEEHGHEADDDALLLGPAPPPSATASWQEWLDARPLVTPTLSVLVADDKRRGRATRRRHSTTSLLREVVLGASDLDGMVGALQGVAPSSGRPNVFWLHPGTLALRLLPSPMSALVLRAGDRSLGQVKATLAHRGIHAHPIGMTGASAGLGQLLLAAPELHGLDIRICSSPEGVSPVFPEGDEVLRQDVLDELNPGIDSGEGEEDGGGANSSKGGVPASRYRKSSGGAMGDCWSEFRAQLKRPSGFLK